MSAAELVPYRPAETALSSFEVMPLALKLAEQLSATDFVPKGLRGNKPAIMAAILYGHEVGLPPMASLNQIYVYEGRPGLYALGMRALVQSQGHHIHFEDQSATRVTMVGRRRGETHETRVTWTIDDAQRAGLAGKPTWRAYPRSMLMARATGELCRAVFADVLGGMPYTAEELQDGFLEDGPAGPLPQEPQAAGTDEGKPKRTARRTRREVAQPPAPELPQDESAPPEPPLPGEETEPEASVTEPAAPPADPPRSAGPGPLASAGIPAPDEHLTMAQQIAWYCRERKESEPGGPCPAINRVALLVALTGKESGREITREQAQAVLETAKAIRRDEAVLIERDGAWMVQQVLDGGEA